MLASPQTADLLPQDEAARLGVLADSTDQYSLMHAIARCDELIGQLRAVQLMHSQNLCRKANHLAGALGVYEDENGIPWSEVCTTENPCPARFLGGGGSCPHS